MAASRAEIEEWFDVGKAGGATHMIVVCDTFDWEDYPVYVTEYQDVNEMVPKYQTNMQKVMEVYNLSMDKAEQMAEDRAFNL